jgi:hypothetical protein
MPFNGELMKADKLSLPKKVSLQDCLKDYNSCVARLQDLEKRLLCSLEPLLAPVDEKSIASLDRDCASHSPIVNSFNDAANALDREIDHMNATLDRLQL